MYHNKNFFVGFISEILSYSQQRTEKCLLLLKDCHVFLKCLLQNQKEKVFFKNLHTQSSMRKILNTNFPRSHCNYENLSTHFVILQTTYHPSTLPVLVDKHSFIHSNIKSLLANSTAYNFSMLPNDDVVKRDLV